MLGWLGKKEGQKGMWGRLAAGEPWASRVYSGGNVDTWVGDESEERGTKCKKFHFFHKLI